MVTSDEEAQAAAKNLKPIDRSSFYVLGGRAMEIVYNDKELMYEGSRVASKEHPVLIDRYMVGMEVEVDAISDGTDVCIPGIHGTNRTPVFTLVTFRLIIQHNI